MYCIRGINNKNEVQYVAIDSASGYPYWTKSLAWARIYAKLEDVQAELAGSLWTRPETWSSGRTTAPHMISSGIGRIGESGHLTVTIEEIKLETVETVFDEQVYEQVF